METNLEATESSESKENLGKEDLTSGKQFCGSSLSLGTNENSNIKYQLSNKKVEILLKATGDAPIMKTRKWNVESDRTVASIIKFIKTYLKLSPGDNLFVYVNQSFAPSPDQIMLNLYDCFGSDGKLVLHYSKTPAWG